MNRYQAGKAETDPRRKTVYVKTQIKSNNWNVWKQKKKKNNNNNRIQSFLAYKAGKGTLCVHLTDSNHRFLLTTDDFLLAT